MEVIVSNLFKSSNMQAGPCTRSKKNPPAEIQEILGKDKAGAQAVSLEEYCAAHLAMLCNNALHRIKEVGRHASMYCHVTICS